MPNMMIISGHKGNSQCDVLSANVTFWPGFQRSGTVIEGVIRDHSHHQIIGLTPKRDSS
jgi:hypothetical protein